MAKIADADEERAPAPEQVGEPAAGDDQHAEGERVGVDDPLGRGHVGLEVLLDLGDRDVDRREVVGDHEDRDAHCDQREPGATPEWLVASLHWRAPYRRRERMPDPRLGTYGYATPAGWQRFAIDTRPVEMIQSTRFAQCIASGETSLLSSHGERKRNAPAVGAAALRGPGRWGDRGLPDARSLRHPGRAAPARRRHLAHPARFRRAAQPGGSRPGVAGGRGGDLRRGAGLDRARRLHLPARQPSRLRAPGTRTGLSGGTPDQPVGAGPAPPTRVRRRSASPSSPAGGSRASCSSAAPTR